MTTAPEPPYQRIAAEIRRRIADGELAPGQRVPSTRRIAEEWGVALATAARALTSLRHDGTVETIPRVGTVVAPSAARTTPQASHRSRAADTPKRPAEEDRDSRQDRQLSRERIVDIAIEIADTEGLAALSMRDIAARLGVAAMTPYRYVGSKDDLILLMADAAFGEATYPPDAPAEWRPRLELCARTMWRLHRRHPWLAHLSPLTRPVVLPNLFAHSEQVLRALEGHPLSAVTRFNINVLLYSYVQGLAVHLEREARAEVATGVSAAEWTDAQTPALRAIVSSNEYPAFSRALTEFSELPEGYDLDLDTLFELGLGALLDGFARMIEP
ncbi:GntR family transcriptional regulator [Nocardiopsis gilva YIM 90087]|uniref:GntR family transcriptional regulator n=1 Tax=Nocardiopsis gilva YIM 90087 TaxID=1235441 RepID=A0A223S6T7_9ACTN|nr:TetR/AcrR family transcriptional regulator C-terminal domain-containing protein [Nocardiopsis gilva]ASU83831.1 GntR family transcriptional regulator [Nocardiopsis gilva YIM 90087]